MTSTRWVRTGTDGAPLIAVHTWRDEHAHYDRLSAAMGDRAVYSLFPPADAVDRMPRRVDEWVDHTIATLDTTGLAPPYRLVGWSFGGVVAAEAARRLRAAGRAVQFVGLIDTIRPRLHPLSDREFVWYHLGAAAAMPDPERIPYLRQKAHFLAHRRFPRSVGLVRRGVVATGLRRRPEAAPESPKPTDPLMVSVHTAYLNYRGDPLPFPVHLYATEESRAKAQEPLLRWVPWLHGGYRVRDIPGGHFSLFDHDNAVVVARALHTDLEAAARDAQIAVSERHRS